jgi:hypothetical protein
MNHNDYSVCSVSNYNHRMLIIKIKSYQAAEDSLQANHKLARIPLLKPLQVHDSLLYIE